MRILILMVWLLVMVGVFECSGATRRVPVVVELGPEAVKGSTPYEIIWAARGEEPVPQITFEDLQGWVLEADGDAKVGLSSSREQRIWRDRVAKFTYEGGSTAQSGDVSRDQTTSKIVSQAAAAKSTTVWIIPAQPIMIDGEFDSMGIWIFGTYYRRAENNDTNPHMVFVNLADKAGEKYAIELGTIISGGWSLETGVLTREQGAKVQFPMRFESIEIRECDIIGWGEMFLESVSFWKRNRNPEAHSMHPGDFGYLTSEDGMLPTAPAGVITTVTTSGNGVLFQSKNGEATLEYEIDPAGGFLNGITARHNSKVFKPAQGGALRVGQHGHTLQKVVDEGEVVSGELDGEVYRVTWQYRQPQPEVVWTAEYRLKGVTLVVDIRCENDRAGGVSFGAVSGLEDGRQFFVPYLLLNRISHIYSDGPYMACGNGVFVSVLPDCFNSDFSYVEPKVDGPADGLIPLIKETQYFPLTSGQRNDLRDRILISVSPEFAEVLPNARNPVSPNRERMGQWIYFHSYLPDLSRFSTLKRYGLDRLIAGHHNCYESEDGQGYSSISSRWRVRPDFTYEKWRQYRQGLKDLGYLFSTYSYFPSVSPINEYWDENKIALNSSGKLGRGWWYGEYALKHQDSIRIAAAVGQLVQELYPADCTYLDIHSVIGPAAMDYESGVLGAGQGRYELMGNALIMQETRKWHNLVIGEGYHRWLYAGMGDADYASIVRPTKYKATADMAPLVDFDLLKIHPFAHGLGMGYAPPLFNGEDEWQQLLADPGDSTAPMGYYRWVAASLAYGHMGILGYDYTPPLSRMLQYYGTMMAIQPEYLADNVKTIEYHNGSEFVSTSQALLANSQEMGRVKVVYQKGAEVYVNYNATSAWTVAVKGRAFELPPYGWVAMKKPEVLCYRAIQEGHIVEYARCSDFVYMNAPLAQASEEGVTVQGAVYIKKNGSALRVLPCGNVGVWEKFYPPDVPKDIYNFQLGKTPAKRGCEYLAVDTEVLLGKPAVEVVVEGRDFDDSAVPVDKPVVTGSVVQIVPQEQVVDYVIE